MIQKRQGIAVRQKEKYTSKYLPDGAVCVVFGTPLPDPHHIITRKARPDLELEPWNIIPVHHKIHIEMHASGMWYAINKYPQVRAWLLRNSWILEQGKKIWHPLAALP